MATSWVDADEIGRTYGFDARLLERWRNRGCFALGGQPPLHKADPCHRGKYLYSRHHLETASAALKPPLDEFDEDGTHWISFALAVARHKLTINALKYWKRSGCAWLDGRKLRVRKKLFASAGTLKSYERTFLDEAELKSALLIRCRVDEAKNRSNDWLTAEEAWREFGLARDYLTAWRLRPCHLLAGRKIRTQMEYRKAGRSDQSPFSFRVYWRPDLHELASKRTTLAGALPDPDWLPEDVVATRYGLNKISLPYWRNFNCSYLGNRRLRARKEFFLSKHGKLRKVWCYFRPDLELIFARKNSSNEPVHEDSDGLWLSRKAVRDRYRINSSTLDLWRTHHCCHLGRKLRAKRVTLWARRNKHFLELVHHDGDLQQILRSSSRPDVGGDGSVCNTMRDAGSEKTQPSSIPPVTAVESMPNLPEAAGEEDPFAPYALPGYFLKFDIAGDRLRQARLRGNLPAHQNKARNRWFYSVPKARELWWENFQAWEEKQRGRNSKP